MRMLIEHLCYSGNSSMLASEHTSWSPELESCSALGLLWTQECMLMSISHSMCLMSQAYWSTAIAYRKPASTLVMHMYRIKLDNALCVHTAQRE
jgi:hypothetical protein